MTKPKPIDQTRRPRRRGGAILRQLVACPLCSGQVRVVAYRERTVRLACTSCRLRLSLDTLSVANALRLRGDAIVNGLSRLSPERAMGLAASTMMSGPDFERALEGGATDQMHGAVVSHLQTLGNLLAYSAVAQPDDTPEQRATRWRRMHEQP